MKAQHRSLGQNTDHRSAQDSPHMEQILTKVLNSQVKPTRAKWRTRFLVQRWPSKSLAFQLRQLLDPSTHWHGSSSLQKTLCAALAWGTLSTTNSLFWSPSSTCLLVCLPSRPTISVRPQILHRDSDTSPGNPATIPCLRGQQPCPPDGRHGIHGEHLPDFPGFTPLLLCTRTSLGGWGEERARNHFSIYFSGSARQPLLHRKSNTRH